MKIQTPTPIPPQPPRSAPTERGRLQDGATPPAPQRGTAAPAAPANRDTVEISREAAALRSAADATRVAGATSELIASGNREAVVAQPVDTRRLQELMRATGATRETPAPGNG